MRERVFTISAEQMRQSQPAIKTIQRHLITLHKKGGSDNRGTVAIVGSNLALIQTSLMNLPRIASN